MSGQAAPTCGLCLTDNIEYAYYWLLHQLFSITVIDSRFRQEYVKWTEKGGHTFQNPKLLLSQ